jgi:hypothetical protein
MRLESVEELMAMLTGGELPSGMVMRHQPHLDQQEAFSVIWFLQEHLRVLPDHFEQCSVCHGLFDTHCGGFVVDGTDDPDEWQEEMGVTQDMLRQCAGARFCSTNCEHNFWRDLSLREA